MKFIKKELPDGNRFYSEDDLTDEPTKQIIADIIRQQCLYKLEKEIPHGIAVIVESMTITTQNNSSSKVTLTAGKVFKTKGVLDGYLGYADITSYIGENTRIQQYWRTKDNIQVFGIKQRQLTFNNGVDTTITGLKATDEDYEEAS